MKHFLENITPPIVGKVYKQFFKKSGWFGNYSSWENAEKESGKYDSEIIYDKVLNATLFIKENDNYYERDSVVFSPIEYNYPIIANLLWIMQESGQYIQVVDFGGALGSTYFQNRLYFDKIENLSWGIVEQKGFFERGKKYIENDRIHFYESIDDCLKENDSHYNVLLLSSVLQYLPNPEAFVKTFLNYNIEYILIDRTAFIEGDNDRITIQKVYKSIYNASYPAWFFNQQKLLSLFLSKYDILTEFISTIDSTNIPHAYHKGFLLKLKKDA